MPLKNRPNILLIMSDQHSKHAVGAYGNDIVRTPNLDRLSAEGTRFTAAYCGGPLCVPSRMSFLTARTPSRNRVWDNGHILSQGMPTWAHYLGIAGYGTSLIGRMHFRGADQRHGFEERPIGEFWTNHPGVGGLGTPPWDAYSGATLGQCRETVEVAGRGRTAFQWEDESICEAACDYLRERAQEPDERPFAAVVGFWLPHCPYIAPRELFDYYYDCVDIPPVEAELPLTIQRFRSHRDIIDLPEERIRVARAAYFALCEHCDRQVGRILDQLDRSGLADETLVIYCSDHGDMAGEHGCWWKSNYYEGSAGVPLIARLPGAVPAGAECDAVCNLMDLGPTFVEAAGGESMRDVDGRSLWRLMQGEPQPDWPNETFSEFVEVKYTGETNYPSRMIRSGPWKLWHYADDAGLPPALFNLEEDPQELRDLGRDPAYADIRNRLMARLHEGWKPDRVRREALEASRRMPVLKEWGRAVSPECPDALGFPPDDLEDDIELL